MAVTERPTREDIDYEADVEPSSTPLDAAAVGDGLGAPSLIVDDVHVTYRVFGGARPRTDPERTSAFRRLLERGRGHVGAVSEIKAVRGISFVARHGEAIAVIGRNGSGKSTLLRAIAGLLPLSGGAVYVSAEPSFLGVNAALIKTLTGEKNIMIGGLALGLTPQEVRDRFDEVVEFAGIGEFVNLPMQAYSSGMSARLRFAISSAARPDILLIDEALGTGDAQFRGRSQERIDEIRQHAGTVFHVSHSLKAIQATCSRALWIEGGRLMLDGSVEEVSEAYQQFVRNLRAGKVAAAREISDGAA
jgi:teichoic acid transport system ATP-binding protein